MEQHDWQSQEYVDQWVAADAAHADERRPLLRRIANLIPFSHDTEIRVLDIGAGHGALAREVLELFPKAVVVCHDHSEPMLAHARRLLAEDDERVSFVRSDLLDPDWARELTEPFDAVVSSGSIHHVSDPGRIRAIYREIYPLVWMRGAFLNLDTVAPAGPATAQAYQRDRALEGGERLGAVRGQRARAAKDAEPATLENQLRWLREAGFKEADCLWKDGPNVVLAAFRS